MEKWRGGGLPAGGKRKRRIAAWLVRRHGGPRSWKPWCPDRQDFSADKREHRRVEEERGHLH